MHARSGESFTASSQVFHLPLPHTSSDSIPSLYTSGVRVIPLTMLRKFTVSAFYFLGLQISCEFLEFST